MKYCNSQKSNNPLLNHMAGLLPKAV